jgi:predicted ATP-binding protein involved in virulence
VKIIKLNIYEHPVFGSLEIDFRNENGEIADTVILAGENGVGKTQILEILTLFGERKQTDYEKVKIRACLNSCQTT